MVFPTSFYAASQWNELRRHRSYVTAFAHQAYSCRLGGRILQQHDICKRKGNYWKWIASCMNFRRPYEWDQENYHPIDPFEDIDPLMPTTNCDNEEINSGKGDSSENSNQGLWEWQWRWGRVGRWKKKGCIWVFRRFHWWINDTHKKYVFPLAKAKVYVSEIFYIPSFAKAYASRIALYFFIRESKIQKFRESLCS